MAKPNKDVFIKMWPKCFIIFVGIIELLSALVLLGTELGNVSANFWTTNVFAGGWCGLIMLIHFIAISVTACCAPGPPAAFRAAIISVIGLLACGTLIGFDAYFIAQPSTCILTSSCASNAASNTTFSYYLQQSFLRTFKTLSPFSSYAQSQSKFLFQTIQLGVGGLCFILCLIYLIIYYVTKNKALKQVGPSEVSNFRPSPQDSPQYQQSSYGQSQPKDYGRPQQPRGPNRPSPPPRVPQAAPGEVAWGAANTNRRY